jgi:hypothetical protein
VIPYIFALILIFLAVLGTPLFAVILAVAMLGFHYLDVNLSVIAIEIYRIADTPILLAAGCRAVWPLWPLWHVRSLPPLPVPQG